MVKESNDQEMAQSERKSHSKIRLLEFRTFLLLLERELTVRLLESVLRGTSQCCNVFKKEKNGAIRKKITLQKLRWEKTK